MMAMVNAIIQMKFLKSAPIMAINIILKKKKKYNPGGLLGVFYVLGTLLRALYKPQNNLLR